jgi:hypothetical protein
MYVYRYKRWLQAGAGLGTFLSENGEQKAGEALLMFQAGIFVPISPTNIKSKLSATLQVAENEEKEKEDAHSRPRQAVYCELLGRSSLLYAVNYDRRFFTGSGGAGASVGFGYIDLFGVTAFMLPVGVYYLAGSENHHVELGAGITTLGNSTSSGILLQPFGTATVGYRYQPARGFLFRIGFTPMYTTRGFAPWGGASFGAAF